MIKADRLLPTIALFSQLTKRWSLQAMGNHSILRERQLGIFGEFVMERIQQTLACCLLATLFWSVIFSAVRAENQPQPRDAEVAELMKMMGTASIGKELAPIISSQFITTMRRSNPILPERASAVVTEVVTDYLNDPEHTKSLLDQLKDIYLKTFTPAEMQQLIAFYNTPVGRKLTASLPTITSESAQIGQAWAVQMLPGLREALTTRLRSEGLLPRS